MNENYIHGGAILLSRQLLQSELLNKPPLYLNVWIYLLLKANHKDWGSLKRGQGITSIPELQKVFSYNIGYRKETPTKKQIWNILDYLRNPHEADAKGNASETMVEPMIVTQKTTRGLIYTIVKYNIYQDGKAYEKNNEGNSECNNEIPMKELRREQQGNTINNNDNNAINNIYSASKKTSTKKHEVFESVWELYPSKKGKSQVSKKAKDEIEKIGLGKMKLAIERYVKEIEKDRKTYNRQYQNGSTWFNTSYKDYLVEENNMTEIKKEPTKIVYVNRGYL